MKIKIKMQVPTDMWTIMKLAYDVPYTVHISDGNACRVDCKSYLGMQYALVEFDAKYLECETDVSDVFKEFIIE